MAEGLLRHETGDRFDVISKGTEPGSLRPEAVAAMAELGIDISAQYSKPGKNARSLLARWSVSIGLLTIPRRWLIGVKTS